MTLILKQIFSLLKVLNSDTGVNQIAAGVAMGFILGMSPLFSLQTLVVFSFIIIFRVQIGAAFISSFFFKFGAFLFDPVFHYFGKIILELDALRPLFTSLYNLPIIPFTRFNNSIVMGSGFVCVLLTPIIFVISKALVNKYREFIVKKVKDTKIWKLIQATSLYKWYYKYDKLYG